jgi:hypothetical protein
VLAKQKFTHGAMVGRISSSSLPAGLAFTELAPLGVQGHQTRIQPTAIYQNKPELIQWNYGTSDGSTIKLASTVLLQTTC